MIYYPQDPDLFDPTDFKKFETEIIKALDSPILKNEEEKKEFAAEIYEELPSALRVGEENEKAAATHKILLKKSQIARDAVESFESELSIIREEYTDSLYFMGHYGSFVKDNCTLTDVVRFLDCRYNSLSMLETPPAKSTSKELVVTMYLAFTYHRIFSRKPGTSSGRKSDYKVNENGEYIRDKTPFEKICEIVARKFNIKISVRQIRKAKQNYTTWYTLPEKPL